MVFMAAHVSGNWRAQTALQAGVGLVIFVGANYGKVREGLGFVEGETEKARELIDELDAATKDTTGRRWGIAREATCAEKDEMTR